MKYLVCLHLYIPWTFGERRSTPRGARRPSLSVFFGFCRFFVFFVRHAMILGTESLDGSYTHWTCWKGHKLPGQKSPRAKDPPDKSQKTPGEKSAQRRHFYCSGSRQLNHSSLYWFSKRDVSTVCCAGLGLLTARLMLCLRTVPAAIIEHLSSDDVTVQEGDTVVLVCNVTGVPTPDVTWFRRPASSAPSDRERKSYQRLNSYNNNNNNKQQLILLQVLHEVACTSILSAIYIITFVGLVSSRASVLWKSSCSNSKGFIGAFWLTRALTSTENRNWWLIEADRLIDAKFAFSQRRSS